MIVEPACLALDNKVFHVGIDLVRFELVVLLMGYVLQSRAARRRYFALLVTVVFLHGQEEAIVVAEYVVEVNALILQQVFFIWLLRPLIMARLVLKHFASLRPANSFKLLVMGLLRSWLLSPFMRFVVIRCYVKDV